MSADELEATAVSDFRRTTGADARVLSLAHERMPAWDRSWRGLGDIRLPSGLRIAGNWWSRPGLPGRLAEASSLAGQLAPRPDASRPDASPALTTG